MINQTLKESYEYVLNKAEEVEYKKAAIKKRKTPFIIFSIILIASAVSMFLGNRADFAVAISGIASLVFGLQYAAIKKLMNANYDEKPGYRIRIYDDFIVMEIFIGNNVQTVSTTRLDKLTLYSKSGSAIILLFTGVYVFPFKRELIKEGSFISKLLEENGTKSVSSTDESINFAEDFSALTKNRTCGESGVYAAEHNKSTTLDCEQFTFFTPSGENECDREQPLINNESAEAQSRNAQSPISSARNQSTERKQLPLAPKMLSIFAFVYGLIGIFASITITLAPRNPETIFISIIPFILISIVNLVIGAVLLKKYGRGKINVVTSILTCISVIICLLLPPSEEVTKEREIVESNLPAFETIMGIEVPEFTFCSTGEDENGTPVSFHILFEDKESAAEISEAIKKCQNFKSMFPSSMVGLMPKYSRHNDQTKALVYNYDTGEYNSIPESVGAYKMLFAEYYENEDGTANLYIEIYILEYTTQIVD